VHVWDKLVSSVWTIRRLVGDELSAEG
jgi:hypothetical protein